MDIFHGISEERAPRVEHFDKAKAQYNRVGRLNNIALGAVKKILSEVHRAIEDLEQAWSEIQNDLREIDSDTLEQIDFSDEFAAAFNRSSIEMMEQDYFEVAMRRPYLAALHRACAAYVPQRERLFDLYERVKAWNLGHI
ncbi:hypothetical protein OIDMADRAFT_145612 [Oidiodendron maius Zn]|uniref:Uncharacterized protein n=1 Tax=Oidiodendron maius (strain Zn) TaxID=913774 RepID=A0A0C3HCJ3_OIDMZ|nr:hypothetical protein OIDMADRAFT_145612 [Oidiodendron maius Zn]